MVQDTMSTTTPTTSSAGAMPSAERGSASGAVRGGLRGMSFAEQIQMLAPAGAPRRPVQREAATSDEAASASSIELLTNAWNEGVVAFQSAVESLSTEQVVAALPSVKDGLYWLLEQFWPSGTGWAASFGVSGEGTIAGTDGGIPCDLDVAGEGSIKMTLTRSGGEVELAVEVEGEGGVAGKASIKLAKLPVGTDIANANSFTLSVDLGAVDWPTGAWDKLKSGNLQGAFGEVFRSALSLGKNTQLEVEIEGSQSVETGGEVGVDGLLSGKAAVGLKAGLATTVSNPTESKEGQLTLSGSVGAYAGLEFESLEPGTLQVVADLVSYLLSVDFGEVGDTGLEIENAVGLELGLTYPPIGTSPYVPTPVVKLFAQVSGALTALGMSLEEGSAKVSLPLALPDIPGFIAAMKEKGAAGAGSAAKLLPASGIEAEIEGTLAFGSLTRALGTVTTTVFGLSETEVSGGSFDVSFSLEMGLTRDELAALHQSVVDRAVEVANALSAGDLLGALRAYIAAVSGGIAEASAAFINAIKKFEVTLESGFEREYGGETPLAGTVSGVSGSVEGSVASVYEGDLTPGQVAAADIEKVLREIFG